MSDSATGKRPDASAEKRRQATFDRRYRLLELRERREDRALKRLELEASQGRGIRFTSAQATVAGAALALLSAVIGGVIQSVATRDVEAGKNNAQIAIEDLKAKGNINLERQKFETTLILKATEAPRREDQIKNLKFFLNAGFIGDPEGKIAKIDEKAYPSTPIQSTEKAPPDLFKDLRGAVGHLTVQWNDKTGNARKGEGTTFVVTKDGFALTAAQLFVAEADFTVTVSLGSAFASKQPAEVVKVDKDLGVALIKLRGGFDYPAVRTSNEPVLIGDTVSVMGYSPDSEVSLTLGTIYSLSEIRGGVGISAPLSAGHSGSPVFNKNGDVIGLVIGWYGGSPRVVAVRIQSARPILAAAGIQ